MLFFKLQKEKELDNLFFDEIRTSRLLQIERKRRDYVWGPPNYKIYPSDFKYTMCPATYIQGKVNFSGISQIEGKYWAERGSSIHTEYQNDLLHSKKLYPREALPPTPRWPELSFYDPDTGISGRLDGLFLVQGEAIPLEIKVKTTNRSLEGWEEFKPAKDHECQGAIYCWELKRLGVIKEPITKFILAYIHAMYDPIHSPAAERQYIIQYDEKLHEKTTILVDHLSSVRKTYMAGGELICSYPLCYKHTRKRKGT